MTVYDCLYSLHTPPIFMYQVLILIGSNLYFLQR